MSRQVPFTLHLQIIMFPQIFPKYPHCSFPLCSTIPQHWVILTTIRTNSCGFGWRMFEPQQVHQRHLDRKQVSKCSLWKKSKESNLRIKLYSCINLLVEFFPLNVMMCLSFCLLITLRSISSGMRLLTPAGFFIS